MISTHVLRNLNIIRFLWNFQIQNGKGENNQICLRHINKNERTIKVKDLDLD
jgi:hypothetical protein